ncbi:cation:dicarboxylase symporter family transporter [Paraburkholderia sp.]|uniref:dicarboxylate/amino acid:cation symporter n=1 Tax=Paraburkholderia sp. TaxID=1926495 RepID=UPI0023A37CA5|nr:cation:dicarboxylase symporter family transporter [Paraburkholderia sp.]MDE1180918.1 cation:dicarboxylase symporter family transporter [Paraburkholderia sp.]
MIALKRFSNSTLGLLLCFALGALAGAFAPPVGGFGFFVGQLYLSLVNMAAVPLLVVAMFFGLRQLLLLSHPGLRIGTMVMLAAAVVVVCAAGGTVIGALVAPGQHLSDAAHRQLGRLVLQSASDAEELRVTLFGVNHTAASATGLTLRDVVPDNFYQVLASGNVLGILIGTILFGMAFATLSGERTRVLHSVFESIYRSLEALIEYANLLLPVLAFGTAAHIAAQTEPATLAAMSDFLVTFLGGAALLCAVTFAVIGARARVSPGRLIAAMKPPLLVALTSGSATAPIPHTIEAMSTRLGFSRGIAELMVPFGSVFVRAGSALYFSLATAFIANLYDRPLSVGELLMTVVLASVAALVSAGRSGVAGIACVGIVMSALQLPVEAAGVLLLAIDPICEGPRNVVSVLSVCAVVALVSAGLPAERAPLVDAGARGDAAAVLRFAFTRAQLAVASGCVMLAAALIVLMGVGVGAK